MTLYKYRNLNNFRHLVDILLKQRLYASSYFDLNDPMEGQYIYTPDGMKDERVELVLKDDKNKVKICSFSATPDIPLMWAHYADGHRGIAIGVEIVDRYCTVKPITYDGPVTLNNLSAQSDSAIEILSHKLSAWQYEQEFQAFTTKRSYVEVAITHVIYGKRIKSSDRMLLNGLLDNLVPSAHIMDEL